MGSKQWIFLRGLTLSLIKDSSKSINTVFTGNIHAWITKFLTRQRVVVDGDHSKLVHVRSGVPQGTVLGPLLFILYLNDLPDSITSKVLLCANCVMYRSIQNNFDAEQLQSDLDTLSTWQNIWQTKFNAKIFFVLKASHSHSPS